MAINSGQPIQGRHEGGLIGPMRSLVLQSIMGQAAVGMMAAKQAIAQTKLASQQAALNSMTGLAAAPTNVSGNQAIVKDMAAQKYGWTGPEWDALYRVMMMESGFRNTAQNPTSSAYGMFQFLDSTWAGYGVAKTADPTLQTIAGLKYIQARYHDPLGALAHEQTFHWYDNGGYLKPGAVGLNGTGKPEPVFTQEQWAIMSSLIANTTSMASAMTAGAATGNVASESKHTYNVKVDMSGSTFQKDIDVEKAVYTAMVKFQNKTGMNRTIY